MRPGPSYERFLKARQSVSLVLMGYSQVLFSTNPISGVLVALATMINPWAGLLGLGGNFLAVTWARLARIDGALLACGIIQCNGALTGIAIGIYLPVNILNIPLVVAATLASTLLVIMFLQTLAKRWGLPPISAPFVLASWAAIAAGRALLPDSMPVHTAAPWGIGLPLFADAAHDTLGAPGLLSLFLRTFGAVVFQPNELTGLLCLAALAAGSRVMALTAVVGWVVAFTISTAQGHPPAEFPLLGFNCFLVATALCGFFLRLTPASVLYGLAGSVITLEAALALDKIFSPGMFPILAAPFNAVCLLLLALPRAGRKGGAIAVEPLALHLVSSPESYLFPRWTQRVVLSLPFMGTWKVSQGNRGGETHKDEFSYAWDFVVTDPAGSTHRPPGTQLRDYYAFALPVVAPADGVVIEVRNDVADNPPGRENLQDNWGNYCIIDHGGGELSEISHFQAGSIAVCQGQSVLRGQYLGRCGNSGRSREPHIHYQLQAGSLPGAATLPARFTSFQASKSGRTNLVERGVPEENTYVTPL
jgi:urea transporter